MKFKRPSGPIERTAKAYFMPYYSGSEDITPLSGNTVELSSRKTWEPTPITDIKASSYGLLHPYSFKSG